MSGTVIRQVLIDLKVRLDKAKLESPDISGYLGAFKTVENEFDRMTKKISATQSISVQVATSQSSGGKSAADARFQAAQMAHQSEYGAGLKGGNQRDRAIARAATEEAAERKKIYDIEAGRAERQRKDAESIRKANEQRYAEQQAWLRKNQIEVAKLEAAEEQAARKAAVRSQKGVAQTVGARGDSGYLAGPNGAGQLDRTRSQDGINNQATGAVGLGGNTQLIYTAGEAYKMAGEGAFHLARGIVFLTAAGEDEIAVLVRKIAYYQGVFELFKGSVDILNGTMRGTRALTAAISGGTAAEVAATAAKQYYLTTNAALLGSNAALAGSELSVAAANYANMASLSPRAAAMWANVAATNASSTTGLFNTAVYFKNSQAIAMNGVVHTGLQAAMLRTQVIAKATWLFMTGPFGLALAAVGVAGAIVWQGLSAAVKAHGEEVERARIKQLHAYADIEGAARRAARAQRDLTAATRANQAYSEQTSLGGQVNQVNRNAITPGFKSNNFLTETQRIVEEQRLQSEEHEERRRLSVKEQQDARKTFAATAIKFTGGDPRNAGMYAEDGTSFQAMRKKMQDITAGAAYNASGDSAELQQARHDVRVNLTPDGKPDAALAKKVNDLEAAQLNTLERQKEAHQSIATFEKEQLRVSQQQLQTLDSERGRLTQIMQQERSRLDQNRAAQKEEALKNMSAVQRFSQLTPYEQQRQKQLAAKAKAGGVESLNRGELAEYEKGGFAEAAVAKFRIAKGNKEGAQEFFKDAGTFETVPGQEHDDQKIGENRNDFLKRQQSEAQSRAQDAERALGEIIKQQSDARDKVIEKLETVANLDPMLAVLDKLIEKLKDYFARMNEKVDGVEAYVKNTAIQNRK